MDEKNLDIGVNMYEFNKVNMAKLPILKTSSEIRGAKRVVKNFVNAKPATYYMMLNHENRYFTLFNFRNGIMTEGKIDVMANDVIECMENCGFALIDINEDSTGEALEIWVKDEENEIAYMYLLFPYDFGVIEY
jgi:hypothetical protein